VDFFALGGTASYRSEAAGRFNRYIASLGKGGWTLVAVIAGGTYFFEREIQPGRRTDKVSDTKGL
jgi:hypothetical protein